MKDAIDSISRESEDYVKLDHKQIMLIFLKLIKAHTWWKNLLLTT